MGSSDRAAPLALNGLPGQAQAAVIGPRNDTQTVKKWQGVTHG